MSTFQGLLTFTRGSTATYYNRFGLIATAAIDEPRFQHDPTTLTTSNTIIDLTALTVGDSVLIDLPGTDTFPVGQDISVTDSANINRYITAVVEFSNPGSVQVTVKTINGTGSGSSWTLISNLGLLIEEQRTNLLLWSEDFTQAGWVAQRGTKTTENETAPDGSASVGKFVANTVGGAPHGLYQSYPADSGNTHTFTVYLKPAGYTRVRVSDNAYSRFGVTFDLIDEGSVVSEGGKTVSLVGSSIEKSANGWYRVAVTYTANQLQYLAVCGTPDNYTGAGLSPGYMGGDSDGISGVYIWGAQLEARSFPTSYIKTEGTQVTRAADNCSRTLGAEFNANEGCLTAEFVMPDHGGSGFFAMIGPSDEQRVGFLTLDGSVYAQCRGTNLITSQVLAVSPGERVRAGISYDNVSGVVVAAINGQSLQLANSFSSAGSVMRIGRQGSLTSGWANAPIKNARYTPRALTEAELIALTAPEA